MAKFSELLAIFRMRLSIKHRLIALSLLRVALGLITLAYYVQHWAQRAFLWSDGGVYPYEVFMRMMKSEGNLSLYMIAPSPFVEVLLFCLGVVVTIAFTIGYRTRLATILFYLFTWSLYTRNPFLMDGGDNLLYILAFYMMFADCGAYLSIDSGHRRNRTRLSPLIAVIHNFAAFAILVQVALLYLTSSLFKIQGHMWMNGTAIYYILRNAEFNLSPVAHVFYDSDVVVTLLTWSTVIFQMAWPFMVWFRPARLFLFVGAVALHCMIGYFMGLMWFSAVMISAELIVFDDSEYSRAAAWMESMLSAGRSYFRREPSLASS
jgi:hypothetical protein